MSDLTYLVTIHISFIRNFSTSVKSEVSKELGTTFDLNKHTLLKKKLILKI